MSLVFFSLYLFQYLHPACLNALDGFSVPKVNRENSIVSMHGFSAGLLETSVGEESYRFSWNNRASIPCEHS